jgi:hypothetical protein
MAKRWIQAAITKPGALHRQLGVPPDRPIPSETLQRAASAPGVLGRRARLALTLRRLRRQS